MTYKAHRIQRRVTYKSNIQEQTEVYQSDDHKTICNACFIDKYENEKHFADGHTVSNAPDLF